MPWLVFQRIQVLRGWKLDLSITYRCTRILVLADENLWDHLYFYRRHSSIPDATNTTWTFVTRLVVLHNCIHTSYYSHFLFIQATSSSRRMAIIMEVLTRTSLEGLRMLATAWWKPCWTWVHMSVVVTTMRTTMLIVMMMPQVSLVWGTIARMRQVKAGHISLDPTDQKFSFPLTASTTVCLTGLARKFLVWFWTEKENRFKVQSGCSQRMNHWVRGVTL